jgi:hypothetical protein
MRLKMMFILLLVYIILGAVYFTGCDVRVDIDPRIDWTNICLDCHTTGDTAGNMADCVSCHLLDTLSIDNHGDYFNTQPPVIPTL